VSIIRILSVGRNVEQYLFDFFKSVEDQSYTLYTGLVILDSPEDNSWYTAANLIRTQHLPFNLQLNKIRIYQPRNFYEGVHSVCKNDDDIVAIVDCDDQLLTHNALSEVADTYSKNPECLLTYGTYHRSSRHENDREFQGPYVTDNFRQQQWKASHLKTFKYKLFKQLCQEDFMYDDKKTWFHRSGDQAMMLPMLEIAGFDRIRYIDKVIYGLTDHSSKPNRYTEAYPDVAMGRHVHEIVRSRKPYSRVEF
jgi:hypothetical protein